MMMMSGAMMILWATQKEKTPCRHLDGRAGFSAGQAIYVKSHQRYGRRICYGYG
jgi:hypothetical protein